MKHSLITINEVMAITFLKRTSVYGAIKAGDLPLQVKIGRKSLWVKKEIQDWIDKKIKDRERQAIATVIDARVSQEEAEQILKRMREIERNKIRAGARP